MTKFEYFQDIVLNQIINNDDFVRASMPFLKKEYFESRIRETIFDEIHDYFEKYQVPPNDSSLLISLQSTNLSDKEYEEAKSYVDLICGPAPKAFPIEWLIEKTEDWCKRRAFYNVMVEGSDLIGKKTQDFYKTDLPMKMEEALSITFDSKVGTDYIEDWEDKFDFMHQDMERFPTGLTIFDKITKGGLPRKSLTVLMSTTTGGFKSGTMCHCAASWISQGFNVLYISLEMSEEVVSQRIDANLLDIELDDLKKSSKKAYEKKINAMSKRTPGKLMIKEYPTSSAHAGHFRFLLKELQQKKGFKPDIICVDYLNICTSSRLQGAQAANSYQYVKAIAEELRGLAVEYDVAMVSATQGNRDASGASDIEINNVSESIGLPATVDILLGIIFTEEMDERNEIVFKQLKNRFGDINFYRKFALGIEKAKMRLYDLAKNPVASLEQNIEATKQTTRDNNKFDEFEY